MNNFYHTALGIALLMILSVVYGAMLRFVPHGFAQDAQAALWAIPNYFGSWWWTIAALFGGLGAITMFLYMIMNQKFSGLLVSRVILMMAMVCIALRPLNSGFEPWAIMLAAVGGLYASFLIATNWCERQDKWDILLSALKVRKKEQHERNGYSSD